MTRKSMKDRRAGLLRKSVLAVLAAAQRVHNLVKEERERNIEQDLRCLVEARKSVQRYRDVVGDYWASEEGRLAALATPRLPSQIALRSHIESRFRWVGRWQHTDLMNAQLLEGYCDLLEQMMNANAIDNFSHEYEKALVSTCVENLKAIAAEVGEVGLDD